MAKILQDIVKSFVKGRINTDPCSDKSIFEIFSSVTNDVFYIAVYISVTIEEKKEMVTR